MPDQFKNLIDGKWVDATTDQSFPSSNPAEKADVLGFFPRSDHRDVDRAVEAARHEYPRWRAVPPPDRAGMLFRAAEHLVQRKEELAVLMTRENGKILKESRGDVQEAIDIIYFAAGEGRRLFGDTICSGLPDDLAMAVRAPVGVVAAITPCNFPLAIPAWKLAPALAAGNTVVFKPSERASLLAVKLVEILEGAGVPPGVLNLVHGLGEEAGAPLVRHPDVAGVNFTGSSEVGREVAIAAAAERKRVSLRMGGMSAIIVMGDADLDLALEGAIRGAFGMAGQSCASASSLLVQKKVLKEFTDRFVKRTEGLRLGNGLLADTEMGPVVSERYLKRIHRYTKLGVKEGAKLLTGGDFHRKGDCAKGFFYLPTVFADVSHRMRIAQEEIFGPFAAIIAVADLDEAIDFVNSTRYRLSSTVFTRDVGNAAKVLKEIEGEITSVNRFIAGQGPHMWFGGIRRGDDGHREGGNAAIDCFTDWKTVYINVSATIQRPRAHD